MCSFFVLCFSWPLTCVIYFFWKHNIKYSGRASVYSTDGMNELLRRCGSPLSRHNGWLLFICVWEWVFFALWFSTGGSATLQAPAMAQKKTVCLLHPALPVSEPPLSPLPKWTPRRSSKLSSSPPHSPLPLPSPPAHKPPPFASKYSSWPVTGLPGFIYNLFVYQLAACASV